MKDSALLEQQIALNKQLRQQLEQQLSADKKLQATITELQQTIAEQTLLIQQLQQQIEQLLRSQFGKKSERQHKPHTGIKKPAPSKSTDTDLLSAEPRELPATFERVKIVHDVSADQKTCPHCELSLQQIKSITTEQLAYRRGCLYVKKHVRYRYACRHCSQTIITAKMPHQPIDKGLADASLLAQVIIDKYQDALPLYRQEMRWLRQGIALSRSTLCSWILYCALLLAPLVEEMKKDILTARKIHTDDTPVPVLAKHKTHQGRLWVYLGGGGNAPPIAVVYDYTPTRSQQGSLNFLKHYQGYLQADAYAGYDKLYETGAIIEIGCMAHCRRKFYEAYECGERSIASLSEKALEWIGRLYEIERHAKLFTAKERYYYRRYHSKPLLQQFHRWLRHYQFAVLPKSLLGKAFAYALKHWRALTHYCCDGLLDIDNNAAERCIKPLVIGRKNYLFAGSHEGAKAAAVFYSLIETCKLFNRHSAPKFKNKFSGKYGLKF